MTKHMRPEIGQQFGRLTVLAEPSLKQRSDERNRAVVKVKCDCGNEKIVWLSNLQSGNTTSCGCYHKETVSVGGTTVKIRNGLETKRNHGESKTSLYRRWKAIIRRTESEIAHNYKWYGAKGVIVCKEWRENFLTFKTWALENGYAEHLELDRINPDGNYEPDNCKWVTKRQNLRNRDIAWSDELDHQLIIFAKEKGMNPYDVIAAAVAQYLQGGDS